MATAIHTHTPIPINIPMPTLDTPMLTHTTTPNSITTTRNTCMVIRMLTIRTIVSYLTVTTKTLLRDAYRKMSHGEILQQMTLTLILHFRIPCHYQALAAIFL